jgi:transcriptional regulator with XRE-family HTH domain
MKFQERLKQLREEQDLSKRELAVKLGIPPSTYYDYENGKTQPDLSKIIKIAEFFDVNSILDGCQVSNKPSSQRLKPWAFG